MGVVGTTSVAPVAVHAWHAADRSRELWRRGTGAASTPPRPVLATVPAMEPTQHDVHVPPHSSARGAGATRRGRGRGGRGEVRAIARAAGRTCSRPGCETPAAATLVFSYREQVARLVDLLEQGEPQAYDLCAAHADRTRPPIGWELSDTRPPPSDSPRRLDDDETVAVLAAALRGETPPTRVSVVEGGRTGEADAPAVTGRTDASDDRAAEGASSDDAGTGEHADEDPLRAALEELQRVALPDDDVTATAPATPLRRDEEPDGDDDAPPAEGAAAVDGAAHDVWDEVESARAAADGTGDAADGGHEDPDLTLW